jgi:thioredoxin reductase (NADPH)
MPVEDVIIVGAGPAGLATAIQLKRYGINPLLFEREAVGGLLRNANLVENYPGFPRGISGAKLVKLFARQATNFNIEVTRQEVIALDYAPGLFVAKSKYNSHVSRIAVIATGTKPLLFTDLLIPESLTERVFYEVHGLLNVEEKCVAIIGSGDAAFDYALNLATKNQVIILNRGERPKCLPLLWERAQEVSNISYRNNTRVTKLSKDPVAGMLVDCMYSAGELQFHADYLLCAIGREARLDCLSETVRRQASDLEGRGVLYMVGDVRNGIFRQTSIAVGEGVLAAMKIYRVLKESA